MSKSEVFTIAASSFGVGLTMSLGIPSTYEVLRWVIQIVETLVRSYYFSWVYFGGIFFILGIFLIALYYEEQFANFYRIFFVWGPTGIFGWLGGVLAPVNIYFGLLMWSFGVISGLSFRWAMPPLMKYKIWREFF